MHTSFDIENLQEKCTPYTLAVLTEKFEIGEMLAESGLSDPNYKNADGMTVWDIAKKHKLENVVKYLEKFKNGGSVIPERVSSLRKLGVHPQILAVQIENQLTQEQREYLLN